MSLSDIRLTGRTFVDFGKVYTGYILGSYVENATDFFTDGRYARFHQRLVKQPEFTYSVNDATVRVLSVRKGVLKCEGNVKSKTEVKEGINYLMSYRLGSYALDSTVTSNNVFGLAYTRSEERELKRSLTLIGHKLGAIAKVMGANSLTVSRDSKYTTVSGKTGRKNFELVFNNVGSLSVAKSKIGGKTGKDLNELLSKGVY